MKIRINYKAQLCPSTLTYPCIRSNTEREALVEPPIASLAVQHHASVVVQLGRVIGIVRVLVVVQRHEERSTLHRVQRRLVQALREERLPGLGPLGAVGGREAGYSLLVRQRSRLIVQDMFQLHLDLARPQQAITVVNKHLIEAALVVHHHVVRVLRGRKGRS